MRSALPGFPSPKWWPLRSGLCHFTIMALTLADGVEKLHSETLFLSFPPSLVCTCKRIFHKLARKPRNQCKHQQLGVNLQSRNKFCCIDAQSAQTRALSMCIGYKGDIWASIWTGYWAHLFMVGLTIWKRVRKVWPWSNPFKEQCIQQKSPQTNGRV